MDKAHAIARTSGRPATAPGFDPLLGRPPAARWLRRSRDAPFAPASDPVPSWLADRLLRPGGTVAIDRASLGSWRSALQIGVRVVLGFRVAFASLTATDDAALVIRVPRNVA
jgi:hypothetical protein